MAKYPRCALVVEPNDAVRTDLYTALEALTIQTSGASTIQQAMQSLPLGLAKAGAHAYLVPPVSAATVHACLRSLSVSAHLLSLVRPLVGHLGMKEIQARVRRALLLEALARSNGSRRSAAQLLGVTRPAVQKWLRSLASDELSPSESV